MLKYECMNGAPRSLSKLIVFDLRIYATSTVITRIFNPSYIWFNPYTYMGQRYGKFLNRISDPYTKKTCNLSCWRVNIIWRVILTCFFWRAVKKHVNPFRISDPFESLLLLAETVSLTDIRIWVCVGRYSALGFVGWYSGTCTGTCTQRNYNCTHCTQFNLAFKAFGYVHTVVDSDTCTHGTYMDDVYTRVHTYVRTLADTHTCTSTVRTGG